MNHDGRDSPEERMRVRLAAEGYKRMEEASKDNEEQDPPETAKTWSNREKWLMLLVLIFIFFVLLLAVVLVIQHIVPVLPKTCQSLHCVEVAGSVVAAMKWSVDPCEDFYEFSCGNWLQTTVPPPSSGKWSQFSIIQDRNYATVKRLLDEPGDRYMDRPSTAVAKTKDYFSACMNVTRITDRGNQPVLELIQKLGSWSVTSDPISGTWDPTLWNLQNAMLAAYPYATPFFMLGVDIDSKNNTNHEIAVDQGGLLYQNPSFYIGNDTEQYRAAEIRLFKDIAALLDSTADVEEIANSVWELERELALAMTPQVERVDPSTTYHPMSLGDLQALTGDWLDLNAYVDALLGYNIPLDTRIMVYDPDYMSRIGSVITGTDPETLANYLVWTALPQLWLYLPQGFQEAHRQFSQALYGTDSLKERWKSCIIDTDVVFPYVTGGLFVHSDSSNNMKFQVDTILTTIQEEFFARLPKVKWMDEQTKLHALEKVRALSRKVAFPNITRSATLLDKHYENITVGDDAFVNFMRKKEFATEKMLSNLGAPVDRSEWAMSASEVNAYYDPQFNEMVFPAGILQRVFYDPIFPMAMNYGALGMVMGHELTHGFDNMGRHFDKYGNMVDWWSNHSSEAFQEHTQCLVDQYNTFPVGEHDHVNGYTTLGENIADNGGVKTAFHAYKNWLKSHDYHEARASLPGLNMTEDQLFFVAFAQVWCVYETEEYKQQAISTDVHAYGPHRVRGVVSNTEEFARAFNCAPNSPMNPENKCVVW